MSKYISFILPALLMTAGMATAQPRWSDYQYDADGEAFTNPERGFYKYTSRGNAEEALSRSMLENYYEDGYTLIYRIYYMGDYVDSPIAQEYLDRIREDFQAVRQSGLKVVLRFAYTSKSTEPYGDATPEWVLYHIGQLEPLVRENADVIAVWQAGFIGAWGEWYYTDYFATGSPNNVTDEDLQEREAVIRAMLDALPLNRQVQLRTPQHKRRIFGDEPLTEAQAYDGSDQARTGHHNDCFLSSSTDVGTYNTASDRPYLVQDSKYTSMGGETCRWYQARSNCDTAMVEMDRYNWDYLNIDYFGQTIQQWKDNGCFDEIWKNLGYRYRMVSATFMDSARSGGAFAGRIELVNEGYSNPMNERYPELVLRNVMTGEEFSLRLDKDLRRYPEGEPVVLEFEAGIPASMSTGYYELFLNLPDPMPTISGDSRYSIRLANLDSWEPETGYNSTQHTLVVDPEATGMEDTGADLFTPRNSSGLSPYETIRVDGDPGDWEWIPELGDAMSNAHGKSLSVYNDGHFLYGLVRGEDLLSRHHRFFIDLDRDQSTGYDPGVWTGAGADFLIDNGTLKQYKGTDGSTDWNWDDLGNFPFAAGASSVEWAVPLNLLGDAVHFSLGYQGSVNGISDLEYLPVIGSLLDFTLDQNLQETPEMFVSSYEDNVLVYWGTQEGGTDFRVIERADGPDESFRVITLLSPGLISYTDRNLTPSNDYRYRSYLTDQQQKAMLPSGVLTVTPDGESFRYTEITPDGLDQDWRAVAPVTAVYRDGTTSWLKLFGDSRYLNFLLEGADLDAFRIYIDTDPGAGTGSGPGVWEGEEFDWMVGPDSLFAWDGGWIYQGSPEMAAGTGHIEGRIPYSLMEPIPDVTFRTGVLLATGEEEICLPFREHEPATYTRIKPAGVPKEFVVNGSQTDPSALLIPQWQKNTEVDGYDLERSRDDSLHFELLVSPDRKDYRYIDEDVEPSSDYFYRLRSYNMAGPSDFTPAVKGHTFGVGTGPVASAARLAVWPNPAGQVLHIRLDSPGREIKGIEIFDLTGRKVASYEGAVRTVSLEGMPAGVYQLRVTFGSGYSDTRFVKQ